MLRTVALIFGIVLISAAQTVSPLAIWLGKADQGDASAQFWLGAAYESGRGIKQDFAHAIKWLGKSAKQGNSDAEFLLGQMYEDVSQQHSTGCAVRSDRVPEIVPPKPPSANCISGAWLRLV